MEQSPTKDAAHAGSAVLNSPSLPTAPRSEQRSIEHIPEDERHGKVWHQGPLWFMGNAELGTLTVGLLGVSLGGNLFWSLVAIILGALFGTVFMAFHAGQGPHLGLPQMIQSRAQFGYIGAIVPLAVVVLLCIGLGEFSLVIGGSAVGEAAGLSTTTSIVLVAAAAAVLAGLGYTWIHGAQRYLTYGFLVVFTLFTIGALFVVDLPASQLSVGQFALVPFLVQFGAVAGYQLSWAPYVSDYSRYLPSTVSTKATVWWTYLGSAGAAIWLMGLGAFLLAASPSVQPVDAIKAAGDAIIPGFGSFALLFAALGMVTIASVNMYSGSLTVLSLIDSVKPIRPTRAMRIVAGTAIGSSALIIALMTSEAFLNNFGQFLLIVLYFMTPWTAVNLVDYYLIRRGHYVIADLLRPDGVYGRWQWRGLLAYFIGFSVMIPFFSTSMFTGWAAAAMGGADVSVFIGLPVAGLLYFYLAKREVGSDLDADHDTAPGESRLARPLVQSDAVLRGEPLPDSLG